MFCVRYEGGTGVWRYIACCQVRDLMSTHELEENKFKKYFFVISFENSTKETSKVNILWFLNLTVFGVQIGIKDWI